MYIKVYKVCQILRNKAAIEVSFHSINIWDDGLYYRIKFDKFMHYLSCRAIILEDSGINPCTSVERLEVRWAKNCHWYGASSRTPTRISDWRDIATVIWTLCSWLDWWAATMLRDCREDSGRKRWHNT